MAALAVSTTADHPSARGAAVYAFTTSSSVAASGPPTVLRAVSDESESSVLAVVVGW